MRNDLRSEYVRLVRAAKLRRIGQQIIEFGAAALVVALMMRAAV